MPTTLLFFTLVFFAARLQPTHATHPQLIQLPPPTNHHPENNSDSSDTTRLNHNSSTSNPTLNNPRIQNPHPDPTNLTTASHLQMHTHPVSDPSATDLSPRIATITALLNEKTALLNALSIHSARRQHAIDSLHDSMHRKNTILLETRTADDLKDDLHLHIAQLTNRLARYERTLTILTDQEYDAKRAVDRLRGHVFSLMRHNARLADALRERGLEHWVENSVKDTVGPFVSDALVQGTASVVEPVLDGIETLALVNGHLSDTMKQTLRHRVPIVEKPFYAGFVTYVVLLAPTVLVASLVMKVKRGISRLSLRHVVILGNLYFLLLSAGCFVATLLGAVDVLFTFRHYNLRFFDFAMVIHGLLYVSHVFGQVRLLWLTRERGGIIHVLLLCIVGLHFFVHSYRHAMHHEDPHVDKRAYLFYTGIFLFVLYESTSKLLRQQRDSTDMKLNNTSISTATARLEREAAARAATVLPMMESSPTESSTRISFLNQPVNQSPAAAPNVRSLQAQTGSASSRHVVSGFPRDVGSSSSILGNGHGLLSSDSKAARDL